MLNLFLKIFSVLLFFSFCITQARAQDSAKVEGIVVDEQGYIVYPAEISRPGAEDVFTDTLGKFTLTLPINEKIRLTISSYGYEPEYKTITLSTPNEVRPLRVQMSQLKTVLDGVEVRGIRRIEIGQIVFDADDAGIRPDPTGGIEGMLKVLVGSKNEMSSQYAVRGGNFDENLVYINDFEVYRPFLARTGQQEGLSVINPDLTGRVEFSVGGFQARMGDKLSSALDITYKKPKEFGGSFMVSLLGLQGHIETASKNDKFYFMTGIRSKTNQILLQAQPTKGQYIPSFLDAQLVTGYRFSPKLNLEFLGNFSRNKFTFYPEKSAEFFGFINQAYVLNSVYRGGELDQFDAMFGGLSLNWTPNDQTHLKFMVSAYQTNEKETYDIEQEYFLSAVETDLGKNVGDVLYSLGTGQIITHARNYLQAAIFNFGHKGSHTRDNHVFQWGANLQTVQIYDRLKEWEYRDSAGYSQPHNPYVAATYSSYDVENELQYQRVTAYVQDNIRFDGRHLSTLNLGVRVNYSLLNKELIVSPRLQYSIVPDWSPDRNIILRFAAGMYAQPPFYREMRSYSSPLHTALPAQKSWQATAGVDWNFKAWNDRPFKFTGEVFYKYLWDITPYEFDNVRIRYYPERSAIGYAYGAEARLFGELVKDAESWISIGFLKTENKFLRDDGSYTEYIPRPTDQRVNFGMYFSDYLPRNKNFKVFLNMLYSTGLPFNLPGRAFEQQYQIRIPDYRRVDIGFATLLLDGKRAHRPAYSIFSHFDDIWLSLEVFNLLGNMNTLSYNWIQPLGTEASFLVPNRLTSRLVNLKLALRF